MADKDADEEWKEDALFDRRKTCLPYSQ